MPVLQQSGLRRTASILLGWSKVATFLLLALLVSACVSPESWEATRLLQDIDAGSGPSTLKETTPTPIRRTVRYAIDERAGTADFYDPRQPIGGAMILVPGFTRLGKDDPRVIQLARSLARARFLVMVPEIVGSRQQRVRLDDARSIADALLYLADNEPTAADQGVGIVAISYAFGLAVLGSLMTEDSAPDHYLVGIGGYYDTKAVVTFSTTGAFRPPGSTRWQRGQPLPASKWIFLASNVDVLHSRRDREGLTAIAERCLRSCDAAAEARGADFSPEGKALLALITNQDPARVPALLEDLPAPVIRQLEALSLRNQDLSGLAGRVILVHGRLDPMVPFSESLAFAEAVPRTEVFLIDGFSHINPRGVGWGGQLQLISAIQAVLKRRRPPP